MTVRVTCPNPDCGNIADVEEQSLGKRGRCKKCGHVFALARPDGEPASMISGDASAWKKGSAPASPTNLPEQFGRYRIMKTLGQGGMGAVYLAHDTKLDRQVALKVPFFSPADGPQAIQRFEREARAVATLDHPNLCPIFDVGEVDGIHYLTMPYIQGKTLADAIPQDQTFTEAQAAAVTRKLALALREAHDKGIIHRDLKPGNIMINRHRELIIMDFGLARVVDNDDKPITRTGHVLGTALYMAPEQAAGDINAIGPAADVYSLGVILHELLTGRRPFEGPWSLVIGLKNVKDPEPPSKLRPDLSPALDAICLKAIAKDRNDRYQTMAEFAGALDVFLAAPAPTVSPSGVALPGKSPDSLAVQVFAGLITQEETSLRGEKSLAQPRPVRAEGTPPRPPGRPPIAATSGAVAALLLGVILYFAIDKGRSPIAANNPKAIVKKLDRAASAPKAIPPVAPADVATTKPSEAPAVDPDESKPLLKEIPPVAPADIPAPPSSATVADLTAANDPTGFKPLFNGKDLSGWVIPPNKDLFTVEDGAILGRSGGNLERNEYLVTDRPYGDFILKARVTFTSGNSGLQFRSKRTSDGLVFGPQADIGKGCWGLLYEERGRGVLVGSPDGNAAGLVREGDWNDFLIQARGDRVRVSFNGLLFADRTDPKFDKRGIIGLQLHVGPPTEVRFKDIEIKELSTEVDAASPARKKATVARSRMPADPKKSAARNQPATRGIAAEAFRPGSVWVSDGGMFEIIAQEADRFTARYTSKTGNTVREIHGFVEADRFRWLASDVVAIKGNQGGDNWGVVRGDEISVSYSVNGGPTTTWSARLDRAKAPGAVGTPAGPSDSGPMPPAGTPRRKAGVQPAPPGPFMNSMGMKLVPIPAGEFTMGSDQRDEERPPHPVRITRPFFLAAHEVTQAQYQAVMGVNPSHFPGDDARPVETVTWLEAVQFCNKLSLRERRKPYYEIAGTEATILGGEGYRLPTEAEWEYACGDEKADRAVVAWFNGNAEGKTHPVGSKPPNRRGLHDMLGNVWEWCQDGFDPNYYKQTISPNDPPGPLQSSSRVVRGGSWYDGAEICQPTYRTWNWFTPKGLGGGSLGFRLACSPPPEPNK